MAKDKDAEDVLLFLKSKGYEGDFIERTDKKTPDIWVYDGKHKYVIEVKSKSEAQERVKNRDAVLLSGEIFEEIVPIVPKNTIDGVISDGCKQLAAAAGTGDFYLLWIKFQSFDPKVDVSVAKQTILGVQDVWDVTNGHTVLPCYYYKNSSFFKNRKVLDGVIFEFDGGGEFWINNLSPRYKKLKKSNFIEHFPPNDPLEKESKGDAYIVDGEVDRADEDKILSYLMKKYKSKNIKSLNINSISGTQKFG